MLCVCVGLDDIVWLTVWGGGVLFLFEGEGQGQIKFVQASTVKGND